MILVTGATGTIGRELVPRLLEAGERVRVFVRDKQKVQEKRVEIAVGDLRQPAALEQALRGVDRVFLVVLDMGIQQDKNFLDRFDEFSQAMMQSRPSLLSQSSAELLLSLIPERKSPAQAIRAEPCKHDIPRAAVYALYLNQALLPNAG